MKNTDFKDPFGETRLFSSRALILWVVLLLMTLGLVARLFNLQVVQHDRYATISDNNRVLLQPVAPNRGLIFDVNGELLADNRASHSLNITLERVKDLDATLVELQSLLPVSEQDIAGFHKRRKQHRRPFQPVPLRFKLTEEEIARVAVKSHLLPGVSIEAELVRYYPLADSTAHVLGYVGSINEQELKRIDQTNYSATQSIGKIGLERFYEDRLHGAVGFQKVEINARGRVLRVLEREPPVPGVDITLYLDSELQRVAEAALDQRRGAVVAMDTRTGGVVALASQPGFDPNLFVTGIDIESYAQLRDSPDLPLFNRALRGQYPPGSTIKPMVALAALNAGETDWEHTVYDPGWYQITKSGRFYRDWKKQGHGRVDLNTAIVQSCDTYFYEMAHHMGIDVVHDFMAQFGFGQRTILDSHEALKGILPSTVWKKNALGESWYTGDSLNASIGQGFMLATPLQLAIATVVMANRGKWVQPRLMKSITQPGVLEEAVVESGRELKPYDDISLRDPKDWERMVDAMEDVVHGERGTAKKLSKGLTYRMAGKSGTAQVVGIKQDEEYDVEKVKLRNQDHALFIAFAPADAPEIAVAVIVENGGGGGATAGPVARAVIDAYMLKHHAPPAQAADNKNTPAPAQQAKPLVAEVSLTATAISPAGVQVEAR